jgi:hypothetical protein
MVGDDHVGERLGESVQVPRPDAVLEAGAGGLGGQGGPGDRVASHEELVDRVGLELGRVVRIRVAAGQPEAALADQRGEIVRDLARLAPLGEAGRQVTGQGEVVVDHLEQDRSAVGTLLRRVEGGDQGLVEQRGEQQRLDSSLFGHSRTSSVKGSVCAHRGSRFSRAFCSPCS